MAKKSCLGCFGAIVLILGCLVLLSYLLVETTPPPTAERSAPPAVSAERLSPPSPEASPPVDRHPRHDGMVIRIVDGDTMMVKIGDKQERIRLRHIDAPEKGEPGFDEATEALRKKFPGGSRVIVTEYARDKWARMIAEVEVAPKIARPKESDAAAGRGAPEATPLETFEKALKASGDMVISVHEGSGSKDDVAVAEITVSRAWHYEPKAVRIEMARDMQKVWAKLHPGLKADSCRIKLIDSGDRPVGGSRMWGGTLIWVED